MKKIFLSLIAVLAVYQFTYAQFILAPNGTDAYNTNSGNVGIGTTSPAALLHLNGPLNGTSSLSFGVPGSTGNLNVPVGSSPGGYNIDFYTYRDIAPTQIGARIRAERINGYQPNNALLQPMDLAFYTSYGVDQSYLSEKLRIKYNGNVGIGTISPSEVLDVNGNPVFGTSTERLSMGSGTLGFNRRVATGAIYDNTKFAYQFTHTGSSNGASDYLALQVYNPGGSSITPTALIINGSAQVGINTNYIPAGYQFAVNGSALATSITVQLRSSWPDYVFNKDYTLRSLTEVKTYIDQNHHLPEIPSAEQIAKDGLNLGGINTLLLKKVEELTLYTIASDKEIKDEKAVIQAQQAQIDLLINQVAKLSNEKIK
jgi:hypothetical protein